MTAIKIVATIGPRTNNPEALRALAAAGMGVARLNGSHNTLEWHAQTISLLRQVVPQVPILLDIPGRKIRVGRLEHEPVFAVNDTIVLTADLQHDGSVKVPVNNPDLYKHLSPDDTILADDGQLRFTVLEVAGKDIVCRAETAGRLRSFKGINVPMVNLHTELVTQRDHGMLAFACEHGLDFVGISFVESAAHVQAVGKAIGKGGPRIVAKIENRQALQRVEEIARAADVLMIDRGDLSVETNLESVALFQKHILEVAQEARCPVIVATEMLHSMIESSVPTKSEISDITNAVLDGAAALMLSGETAVGQFPVEAVMVMRKVADKTWEHVQAAQELHGDGVRSVPQAMGDAVALLCRHLPITKIVAITISGFAARMVASQRPRQPILAVSNHAANARSFNLLPGTRGLYLDIPFSRTSTDHIARCLEVLWRSGDLVDEDMILVTSVGYPQSGTRMNLIETHHVADLRGSLGWKRG